ncbi:MAG: hypothetical protein ACD_20C00107G0001 [uncultured bacterium]|nr:MAG: hypothetical protein ACD_20C00107G0001 [uncultured bacterium]
MNFECFLQELSSSKYQIMWASIPAIVAAIGAAISAFIAYLAYKEILKSKRPYIAIGENVSKEKISEGFKIKVSYKNQGNHPATNLKSKYIIVLESLDEWTEKNNTISNEIPIDLKNFYLYFDLFGILESNPFYLIFLLKYKDAITGITYTQDLYYKVTLEKNAFENVQEDERLKIIGYLRNENIKDIMIKRNRIFLGNKIVFSIKNK